MASGSINSKRLWSYMLISLCMTLLWNISSLDCAADGVPSQTTLYEITDDTTAENTEHVTQEKKSANIILPGSRKTVILPTLAAIILVAVSAAIFYYVRYVKAKPKKIPDPKPKVAGIEDIDPLKDPKPIVVGTEDIDPLKDPKEDEQIKELYSHLKKVSEAFGIEEGLNPEALSEYGDKLGRDWGSDFISIANESLERVEKDTTLPGEDKSLLQKARQATVDKIHEITKAAQAGKLLGSTRILLRVLEIINDKFGVLLAELDVKLESLRGDHPDHPDEDADLMAPLKEKLDAGQIKEEDKAAAEVFMNAWKELGPILVKLNNDMYPKYMEAASLMDDATRPDDEFLKRLKDAK